MGGKRTLAAYTFAHFSTDFACFHLLFGIFAPAVEDPLSIAFGLLLYNVIAFGLQPILGALCDATAGRGGAAAAPLGCCLLLVGLALSAQPWPALVLVALGNALLHIGGGIDALANAGGKMARSGVFVSSGALGVALGTLWAHTMPGGLWLPALLAGLSLAATLPMAVRALRRDLRQTPAVPAPQSGADTPTFSSAFWAVAAPLSAGAVVILCSVSIIIRAWGGGLLPLPWKTTALLGLLPGTAAFCGKALGGFLADRFGPRTVGVLSLLLAAPLLGFGYGHPVLAVLGLLLFNINMSITLCAIADKLPKNPGLAFGITTLALLCGTVPLFFRAIPTAIAPGLVIAATVLSAGCLFFAVRNPSSESEVTP